MQTNQYRLPLSLFEMRVLFLFFFLFSNACGSEKGLAATAGAALAKPALSPPSPAPSKPLPKNPLSETQAPLTQAPSPQASEKRLPKNALIPPDPGTQASENPPLTNPPLKKRPPGPAPVATAPVATAPVWTAQLLEGEISRASLISPFKTVRAGETVLFGLLLQTAKGWHTYGTHPGEAGFPPQIRFRLTAGPAAGRLTDIGSLRETKVRPKPQVLKDEAAASAGSANSALKEAPDDAVKEKPGGADSKEKAADENKIAREGRETELPASLISPLPRPFAERHKTLVSSGKRSTAVYSFVYKGETLFPFQLKIPSSLEGQSLEGQFFEGKPPAEKAAALKAPAEKKPSKKSPADNPSAVKIPSVKIPSGAAGRIILHADIEWPVCSKEVCRSLKDSASLVFPLLPQTSGKTDLAVSKEIQDFFQKQMEKSPAGRIVKADFQVKNGKKIIRLKKPKGAAACRDIHPEREEDFSAAPPQRIFDEKESCVFEIETTAGRKVRNIGSPRKGDGAGKHETRGLLLYTVQKGDGLKALSFAAKEKTSLQSLLYFIVLAFLGGLLLNVMPCVLPVIFLKLYSVWEMREKSGRSLALVNLSWTGGVVFSFLILAFFVAVSKKAGEAVGWGFHLQSPVFVSLLSLVFLIMALFLLNKLNLPLPRIALSKLKAGGPNLGGSASGGPAFGGAPRNEPRGGKPHHNEPQGGGAPRRGPSSAEALSHFLTGALTTTAASPCTVPLMAPAVAFAFSRSHWEIFSVFLFLGLGLSSPYLLLSRFPRLLRRLPGPKQWMERLKIFLALPLFGTALWLFWILSFQLSLKVFVFSLILIGLTVLFLLLQKKRAKKALKGTQRPLSKQALIFLSRTAPTAVATLSLIVLIVLQTLAARPRTQTALSEKPPPQQTEPAAGKALLKGRRAFSPSAVQKAREAGKNVFVAFGAEWCLSCKVNERVFNNEDLTSFFQERDILFFYGDWTDGDPSILKFLKEHGSSGVPFYIFFKGTEKTSVLPVFLFSSKTLVQPIQSALND